MGHSVKSEYHIWVILRSCVPKVWRVTKIQNGCQFFPPRFNSFWAKASNWTKWCSLCKYKEKWMKNYRLQKSSIPMHKLTFIWQSTIHCISSGSPVWPLAMNGVYKLCHSLLFQESAWSAEAWRCGWCPWSAEAWRCGWCPWSDLMKMVLSRVSFVSIPEMKNWCHTSNWKHDLANNFESQILISNWYLLFWYGCRWTPRNGGVWAINKIVC